MQADKCPSEQDLRAFQLGDLPEASLVAVASHLEICPRCETAAQRLDTLVDPILASIRVPPSADGNWLLSDDDPTVVVPSPQGKKPAQVPDTYSFLLPALEPDELGRLSNYRVLRLLEKGSMALVFEAEDIALKRPVALKVLKPDLDRSSDPCRRFVREAQIMAAIKHEHLVTIYQTGQDRNVVYLAMELLEGETLGAWLNRGNRASLPEILRLGREITSGLAIVHSHGLIHRDVKPDNIWLESPGGKIKILDFGLARFAQDDTHLTHHGTIMGTPSFMSPEQARGEPADARSDLYSLGAVLYCLCTGRKPFQASNMMALLTALAVDDPAPVHELNPVIPRDLSNLVMQLLDKDASKRPQNAAEVLMRIGAIERGMPDPLFRADPVTVAEPAPSKLARYLPKTFRSRALTAGIGVALVLVVAFAVAHRPGPPSMMAPAAGAHYLSDMQVVDPMGWPFLAPLPRFPDELPGMPPSVGGHHVRVGGKYSPRGIFMHLPPEEHPRASISYHLDGRYRTFDAEVSLNDGPPECSPMTFAVYGDGKLLWKSQPVATQADTQTIKGLDIRGVDKLTLEVSCEGSEMGTHAVWIEPRVN